MKLYELTELLKTTNPSDNIRIIFNDGEGVTWKYILIHFSTTDINKIKNCEVVKMEKSDKTFYIYIFCKRQPEPGKEYYFRVRNVAEGETTGYVKLTLEQAQLVAFATNSDNWKMVDSEPWSINGIFRIDITDFRDVEEVEGDL